MRHRRNIEYSHYYGVKYKLFFLIFFLFLQNLKAQVGINTNSPIGVFHVDGAKDNVNTSPTVAQQLNDVNINSAGNIGIGTTNPTVKVDVVSNTVGTSGLWFTQLNSSSPATVNDNTLGLGVDGNGNVVTTDRPFSASVTSTVINGSTAFLGSATAPYFILPSTAPANYTNPSYVKIPLNLNSSGTMVDSFTINVPVGGRGVLINFMLGIDAYGYQGVCSLGPCNNIPNPPDIFQARLYIDNVAQNVFQNVQMNSGDTNSNMQYNFSTLQVLSAGNHIIDVRVSKVSTFTGYTDGQVRFQVLSTSINSTYLK